MDSQMLVAMKSEMGVWEKQTSASPRAEIEEVEGQGNLIYL